MNAEATARPAPGEDAARRRLRVLLVAPERVHGGRWTGPLIRAARIARHLAADHDVSLAMEGDAAPFEAEPFRTEIVPRDALPPRLDAFDVVVSQGTQYPARIIARARRPGRIRQVFDLYTPVVFENLQADREVGRPPDARAMAHLWRLTRLLLRRADYVVCASEEQRDLLLGQLFGGDWRRLVDATDQVSRVIGVVPFGHDGGAFPPATPDDAPAPHDDAPGDRGARVLRGVLPGLGDDEPILLWGGGVWNWFDPLTLLHAMARLRDRRPAPHLVFLGVRHPSGAFTEYRMLERARALADELGLTGRTVHFNDAWVPFDRRHLHLAESTLAVCTAPEGLENHFSFRTRLVDAVWAGLPIVCTRGGTMARFVERTGGGRTVAGGDAASLAEAIAALLEPGARAEARARLLAARDELQWEACVAPLRDYLDRVAAGDEPARRRAESESRLTPLAEYLAYKLPIVAQRLLARGPARP